MHEMYPYQGLEPTELWRHFAALNRIPRPSGKEEAVSKYVTQIADGAGAPWERDRARNVVVYVAATAGAQSEAPVTAVQGHLDMVCEKSPSVRHDFAKDPIRPRRDGDRIIASGTTLGADNGIGVAAALALLTTPGLLHGPLELLFTVEEETGLWGAAGLDASLLRARFLINLDSESAEQITVGSAGGGSANILVPLIREKLPKGWVGREVSVSGLRGGHSGLQIHEERPNALKLLTRLLFESPLNQFDLRLLSIEGGNADNAIPREGSAHLAVPDRIADAFDEAFRNTSSDLFAIYAGKEPDLRMAARPTNVSLQALVPRCQETLSNLLRRLPHGILRTSDEFQGKVMSSANLAQVIDGGDSITVVESLRSFDSAELDMLFQDLRLLASNAGARLEIRDHYPGWPPNPHSQLVSLTLSVYRRLFRKEPHLEVVHGGLECGAIVAKLPNLDAISFGPRIDNAHTSDECVYIPTVNVMWKLLTKLLQTLGQTKAHDDVGRPTADSLK